VAAVVTDSHPKVGQHILDDHKDHHFILDNEDMTIGTQFTHHEDRAVQEC
jgi:hypothetical protein